MLHPAPLNAIGSSLAIAECIVEYTGHTAHAAGAPWEAINAQVGCEVLAERRMKFRELIFRFSFSLTSKRTRRCLPTTTSRPFGSRWVDSSRASAKSLSRFLTPRHPRRL